MCRHGCSSRIQDSDDDDDDVHAYADDNRIGLYRRIIEVNHTLIRICMHGYAHPCLDMSMFLLSILCFYRHESMVGKKPSSCITIRVVDCLVQDSDDDEDDVHAYADSLEVCLLDIHPYVRTFTYNEV